jgi:divalent metal cation (Fe/Co/Zn/Cd) transporter
MHHEEVIVDCIRAYHFGSRYMVEMEIVMPIDYTLKQVHDISLELQLKVRRHTNSFWGVVLGMSPSPVGCE